MRSERIFHPDATAGEIADVARDQRRVMLNRSRSDEHVGFGSRATASAEKRA